MLSWRWRKAAGDPRQGLGRVAERMAGRYLREQGYSLVATNVRTPRGELDLVAWEGTTLCFVEVRSGQPWIWGDPLASIQRRKRHHLLGAAQWYLAQHAPPEHVRFDAVAVEWAGTLDRSATIRLVRDAFDASEPW